MPAVRPLETHHASITSPGYVILFRHAQHSAVVRSQVYPTIIEAASVAKQMVADGKVFMGCLDVKAWMD